MWQPCHSIADDQCQRHTGPTITCPGPVSTCGTTTFGGSINPGTATAIDNCNGAVTILGHRADGLGLLDPYPYGTTVITWTATDSCGNPSTCTQKVTICLCLFTPTNGLTLGFWSNSNGQAILAAHDTAWRGVVNGLNLRNANGSLFTVPTTGTFANAYNPFKTWLLGATATNMANMLSAQLAANVLDGSYNGLADATIVAIPNTMADAGLNFVTTINGHDHATLGDLPTFGGYSFITEGDLRTRAKTSLGLYGSTPSGNAQRPYQQALKGVLDAMNNNGNDGYTNGPVKVPSRRELPVDRSPRATTNEVARGIKPTYFGP